MRKIRVGVFFGGRSAEYDISIRSAKSVIWHLDRDKYEIIPIGINREGKFFWGEAEIRLNMPEAVELCNKISEKVEEFDFYITQQQRSGDIMRSIDVAFPVLHGSYGEDGCFQGFCKLFNIPFIGAGVLGSAIAMDKDVAKRLLREAGIICAKSIVFHRNEIHSIDYESIKSEFGNIVFIKPVNLGSSVGISKVRSREEFLSAVDMAFLYDDKIMIEEFIQGREIECAVLGDDNPKASIPGEICVKSDFYSYDAKYIDSDAAELKIPANLPETVSEQIKSSAIKAFKVLCCHGMARVDFFVRNDSEVFLNELNTIPGFTDEISMYPKLWEASGLPYKKLLDELIDMAIKRHKQELSLRTV